MATKTKRKVSTPASATAPQANAALSRRFSTSADFNPDYTQVKAGLKRIGILAGSFLVILIVLSFIL
jgi:hypothetical protein